MRKIINIPRGTLDTSISYRVLIVASAFTLLIILLAFILNGRIQNESESQVIPQQKRVRAPAVKPPPLNAIEVASDLGVIDSGISKVEADLAATANKTTE
jgi:hypothetical protein